MNHFKRPLNVKSSIIIYWMLLSFATSIIIGGLLLSDPADLIAGIGRIITSEGTLVSDYFHIGGTGPALINAGIVTLIALLITRLLKLTYNGMSIAAIMIVAGFSLFGKNPINIAPILLGNYLFSVAQKEKWSRYIYIGLFSTCLAPFVSMLYYTLEYSCFTNAIIATGVGIIIGFVVPTLAPHTATIHMGYDLYNVGFAAGFIALMIMSVLRGFNIDSVAVMLWTKGVDPYLAIGCYIVLIILFIVGFILSEKDIKKFFRITRHSGRAIADFIFMDGVGPTFMNMAAMGAYCLTYIIIIGGDLNGATLGAIITTMGFAAFGMHPKNCAPVTLGVMIGAILMKYTPMDPGIQLAALFGLGLAPIAGQFGAKYGIIAGMLHCAIVTTIGGIYGGLNLYNNGFTAGIVAMILVPFIESFRKEV